MQFYQWEKSTVGPEECEVATYEHWRAFLYPTWSSMYINPCYAIVLLNLDTGIKKRCLYETKFKAVEDFERFVNGGRSKLDDFGLIRKI